MAAAWANVKQNRTFVFRAAIIYTVICTIYSRTPYVYNYLKNWLVLFVRTICHRPHPNQMTAAVVEVICAFFFSSRHTLQSCSFSVLFCTNGIWPSAAEMPFELQGRGSQTSSQIIVKDTVCLCLCVFYCTAHTVQRSNAGQTVVWLIKSSKIWFSEADTRANYGPGTGCGPFGVVIQPTELVQIV